jgi:SPP1 gp7 family putative phage head morphogenesis protein
VIKLPPRDLPKLRLAARAWARRPKRFRTLGKLPSIPLAVEAGYVLRLRQLAKRTAETIQTALKPVFSVEEPSLDAALRALKRVTVATDATLATVRWLKQFDEHNRTAMNHYMSPLTGGISLYRSSSGKQHRADAVVWAGVSPGVRDALNAALTENVKLIKSIPADMLDDVEQVLREHFAKGARVEEIAKALQERYDIGERRAALIARDQSGKVNGQLNEERSAEMGMDSYVWRCSGGGGPTHGDERVRPGHRVLDGTKQVFSDPPVVDEKTLRTANPGIDYNCRCTAEPDVSGYLDAIGA